jgi:hypothetical protein
MRRTFTNVCLKLGIEMWKVELLTSHVPTTTTLVHDTRDLRETCAAEIQLVGDWIELQAIFAARETVASATNLTAGPAPPLATWGRWCPGALGRRG